MNKSLSLCPLSELQMVRYVAIGKSSLCFLSSSSTSQSNRSALSISIPKRFRCYTKTALAQWIIKTALVTIGVNIRVAIV